MAKPPRTARITLGIAFDPDVVLGPGKASLLEGIKQTGSISAAGRLMSVSYKSAWDLTDAINGCFVEPVVLTSKGGVGGGGASLTPFGEELLVAYRRMEAQSIQAIQPELVWLQGKLRKK